MSLRAFLEALRRRWRWVAVATVAGLLAMGFHVVTAPTRYTATAASYFSLENGTSGNDLAQGAAYMQDQAKSYALLATTPAVLLPVIEKTGLHTTVPALAAQIQASVTPNTVLVDVSATMTDPRRAELVANAVSDQLGVTVEQLAPVNQQGTPTVRVSTVKPAAVPSAPSSPRKGLDLAVGLLAGLFLGVLLALLRDATDTRIRRVDDLARVTSRPVVAQLGDPGADDAPRPLVMRDAPRSQAAEAYRTLRTAVQFLPRSGRGLSLLVTSARENEGKSTTAANLAVALAEAGQRVALVDADLRRPALDGVFGLERAAGLTTVLIGQATAEDVLQEWGTAGLRVLASGVVPPNPSELLASSAMADLLTELESTHDLVIVDAPPVLPVTDAVILSRLVSGTLFVGDVTRLRRRQLTDALALFEQVGARVVGIALTHVRLRESQPYADEPTQAPRPSPVVTAASRTGRQAIRPRRAERRPVAERTDVASTGRPRPAATAVVEAQSPATEEPGTVPRPLGGPLAAE